MSIERIRKLIALSGSANEHEARSAAFLACKLIREGDYRVVSAETAAQEDEDPWVGPFAAAWAQAARVHVRYERPPRHEPPPPPDRRPRRRVPCDIGQAPRSGTCAVCGEEYERGSDVASPILASDMQLGSAHADCRARWSVVAE
jgi:hypothetical protein